MKKASILFIFALFLIFPAFGPFAGVAETVQCEDEECKAYLKIFSDHMRAFADLPPDPFCTLEKSTIEKYKMFIQKYPNSEFVGEAKYRIVEFYNMIFKESRELRQDKNKYRQNTKKWLNDIIKNHSGTSYHRIKVEYGQKETGDVYYKDFKLELTKTKIAAWALYYRASWFWFPSFNFEEAKADLLKIIDDYKESKEPVGLAKSLLRKILTEERRTMFFEE